MIGQGNLDGWMASNFTSFTTVFQSYQEDGGDDNERLCAMEPRLQLKQTLSWGLGVGGGPQT